MNHNHCESFDMSGHVHDAFPEKVLMFHFADCRLALYSETCIK